MAMVPMNEMSEMIIAASKYIAFFTSTAYTRINPITTEAIRSMAAIRSFTNGPLTRRIKANTSAASSREKHRSAIVFNSKI
jgi:hypothetical protein